MILDNNSPHYIYPPVQEAEGVAELVDSGADVLEAGTVEVEHLHNYCNSVHSCFSTAR